MSVTNKAWEALTHVIKMNDKIISLASVVKEQQTKIETLTERVIKLEATLEVLIRAGEIKRINFLLKDNVEIL